jgi:hypothetical protein
MPDARAEYARRYVDRVTLRPTGLYWPTEAVQSAAVVECRPATVVDAWWEALGLPLLARRDAA